MINEHEILIKQLLEDYGNMCVKKKTIESAHILYLVDTLNVVWSDAYKQGVVDGRKDR